MALVVWAVSPDRVRRGHLALVGEPKALVRDADAGTFQVPVKMDDELTARVVKGWRVIVQDGEETILSGNITSIEPDLAEREVVLGGRSDLSKIAGKLVFPNPFQMPEAQTDAYFRRTGPASEVIDYLVHKNAGSGALAYRVVPGLAMAVGQGGRLGSTVSVNSRFKNLLEESRAVARLGGVTFDAKQEGSLILFRFRVPVDRSRSVRFTERNGGVTEGRYALAAPTATDVIVAGQGQGAARTILHRTRPSDWGESIEVFKDQRDTDNAAELEQSATEQLDEGAAGASAQFTVTETPGLRYGTDFLLGDIVTVEVGALTISEPVRAVELTWDGHGRTATLTLGDHDQADDKTPAWVKKINDLDARVRGMEVT